MENQNIQYYVNEDLSLAWHNCLKSLEELQSFLDPKDYAFLDKAFFHIGNAKELTEAQIGQLTGFSKLKEFLVSSVKNYVTEGLIQNSRANHIELVHGFGSAGLEIWNKLFEILPIISSFVREIPFGEWMRFSQYDKAIYIAGDLDPELDLSECRQKIYKFTRELLQMRVLATFQFDEKENTLVLKFDFSHDEGFFYAVDVTAKSNMYIGFSSTFPNYEVDFKILNSLGPHLIFEITEDLDVLKWSKLPDHMMNQIRDRKVVHFDFLFRPISIIIPNRGHLVGAHDLQKCIEARKKIDLELKQDVYRYNNYPFTHVDFFKLIAD